MRRLLSLLLVVLLIAGAAYAAGTYDACSLALEMAEDIPEMQDVKAAPTASEPNRAIWTDSRIKQRCALVVYSSADEADLAAIVQGTSHTSVRTVDGCLLEIDSDLSRDIIDAYAQVLSDVLGVEMKYEAPDYILNVNTRKFHYPSCSSVEDMKENNRQPYTGDRSELVSAGYKACKRCNP